MLIDFKHSDPAFGFLSNFYKTDVRFMGMAYPTAEHLYQSLKAENFNDALYIRSAISPSQARTRGREIEMREDWDRAKLPAMLTTLRLKFARGSQLASYLLLTTGYTLREWAPWDSYWGLGKNGDGFNHLGQLLMQVRSELEGGRTMDMFDDVEQEVLDKEFDGEEVLDIGEACSTV
jgi:ribA/ribD-fused uncharacterized protein